MRIIAIAKIKYSLKLARTNKMKVKSVWLRAMILAFHGKGPRFKPSLYHMDNYHHSD